MTAADGGDVFVRGAQWVPIILFHLGLYVQDPEAGWAVLEPGNPLFDQVPIDILAGLFITLDAVAQIGEVTPDDVEDLMKHFGKTFAEAGSIDPEGSAG